MTKAKWLTIIGGVLLLIGILTAFISSHYSAAVMGEARKGVAVFAPEPDSLQWKEKERLLARADAYFYLGLVLTAFGVLFQTWGAVLSMKISNTRASKAEPAKHLTNPTEPG